MEHILELKDLSIRYFTDRGVVEAVNRINLSIAPGETLGLVGETGAGKTTTALGILRLIPDPPGKITEGKILFEGKNLLDLNPVEMRNIRGNSISMIFQDPMTALDPVMPVGQQIAEGVRRHLKCSKASAMEKAREMLAQVGIDPERAKEYPNQFSGGMKQRVVIAIALACNPKLLIADEPTTALDVTIQAQVLEMMSNLKEQLGTSMLLITHDMGVVSEVCDRVAVMYAGEIIEVGTLEEVFEHPSHPYTIGLFDSIPRIDEDQEWLRPIEGLMPDPANLPSGCKFHTRCRFADARCSQEQPSAVHLGGSHWAQCMKCATKGA